MASFCEGVRCLNRDKTTKRGTPYCDYCSGSWPNMLELPDYPTGPRQLTEPPKDGKFYFTLWGDGLWRVCRWIDGTWTESSGIVPNNIHYSIIAHAEIK